MYVSIQHTPFWTHEPVVTKCNFCCTLSSDHGTRPRQLNRYGCQMVLAETGTFFTVKTETTKEQNQHKRPGSHARNDTMLRKIPPSLDRCSKAQYSTTKRMPKSSDTSEALDDTVPSPPLFAPLLFLLRSEVIMCKASYLLEYTRLPTAQHDVGAGFIGVTAVL